MTRTATTRSLAAQAALAAALALSACADNRGGGETTSPPASAPPATSAQSAQPAPAAPPSGASAQANPAGLVVYRDYAAVVAREGDTVREMAERVGISPSELAAYNGLPTSYLPKPGDELVLPPRPEGYRAATPPAPSSQESSAAPLSAAPPENETPASGSAGQARSQTAGSSWDPARIGAAIDRAPDEGGGSAGAAPPAPSSGDGYREVRYHEVGADETVYSIARSYGLPAERLIAWNALSGPSYTVTEGQVLVIPGDAAAPAPEERRAALTPPGEAGDAAPPPSAGRPLPPDTVAPRPLESPQLGRYQSRREAAEAAEAEAAARAPALSEPAPERTASAEAGRSASPPATTPGASGGGRFMRPVPGEILRPYSRDPGGARNDGVDFAAEPGQPVRAAADGTVALVSTSLGEWGNIVLLRHDDRLMTVYGRMGTVAVSKGETVRAGDVLGDVAQGEGGPSTLHFEVRRGALTEDPADYF